MTVELQRVSRLPVPNLWLGCLGLDRNRDNCICRQPSDCRFLMCSFSTARTWLGFRGLGFSPTAGS